MCIGVLPVGISMSMSDVGVTSSCELGRAVSILNHWAISPVSSPTPHPFFSFSRLVWNSTSSKSGIKGVHHHHSYFGLNIHLRSVLTACVFVYHMYDWCLRRSEQGSRSSGTEVTDAVSCYVDGGFNLCPLEMQRVFNNWANSSPRFLFIVGGGDLVCNIVGFSFVFCFSPQNYS